MKITPDEHKTFEKVMRELYKRIEEKCKIIIKEKYPDNIHVGAKIKFDPDEMEFNIDIGEFGCRSECNKWYTYQEECYDVYDILDNKEYYNE